MSIPLPCPNYANWMIPRIPALGVLDLWLHWVPPAPPPLTFNLILRRLLSPHLLLSPSIIICLFALKFNALPTYLIESNAQIDCCTRMPNSQAGESAPNWSAFESPRASSSCSLVSSINNPVLVLHSPLAWHCALSIVVLFVFSCAAAAYVAHCTNEYPPQQIE